MRDIGNNSMFIFAINSVRFYLLVVFINFTFNLTPAFLNKHNDRLSIGYIEIMQNNYGLYKIQKHPEKSAISFKNYVKLG